MTVTRTYEASSDTATVERGGSLLAEVGEEIMGALLLNPQDEDARSRIMSVLKWRFREGEAKSAKSESITE